MAAHKGLGYRTPRTQAMKMGTKSEGFAGAMPYDSLAGVPVSMVHGQYHDSASEEAKMQAGQDRPSAQKNLPFALK